MRRIATADRPSIPRLSRQVPAEPAQIAGIRREVLALAAAHDATDAARADIALAVSEACANVVVHAYRDSTAPGPLTVEAFHDDGELVVIVVDAGGGLGPRTDSPGIGLGLSLMRRLTQQLEITDASPAGTRVLMRFAMAG